MVDWLHQALKYEVWATELTAAFKDSGNTLEMMVVFRVDEQE